MSDRRLTRREFRQLRRNSKCAMMLDIGIDDREAFNGLIQKGMLSHFEGLSSVTERGMKALFFSAESLLYRAEESLQRAGIMRGRR